MSGAFSLTKANMDALGPLTQILDDSGVVRALVEFVDGDYPGNAEFGYDETGTFGFLGFFDHELSGTAGGDDA